MKACRPNIIFIFADQLRASSIGCMGTEQVLTPNLDKLAGEAADNDPFCLFLSYGTPHCPYRELPKNYLDRYLSENIKLRPNAVETADKSIIAGYYAQITALDENVGKLLHALDCSGVRDNTIVIFTSDHGDMLFSQNRGWKDKPWHESVGIPFITRWPGEIKGGTRTRALLGLVDIMPTLLSAAGLPIPSNIDGKDLTGVLFGDDRISPDSQFIYMVVETFNNSYREWRGIVTKKYTYARFKEKDWILYDDLADPFQLNNLADQMDYKSSNF